MTVVKIRFTKNHTTSYREKVFTIPKTIERLTEDQRKTKTGLRK
jgi:hypothetical protein